MNNIDEMQMGFDFTTAESEKISTLPSLNVVKANYVQEEKVDWKDLFSGYDELYGITFSYGINFMEKVMDMFGHVEMIFGCDSVLENEIPTIMAMQTVMVERIAKTKSAKKIAEYLDEGRVQLFVSKDAKSHEKLFVLKAKDGRVRVITGSANMSTSAFCGLQRENIIYFDDEDAFDYYKERFEDYKNQCSNDISHKLLKAVIEDAEYLREHIEETPIGMEAVKDNIVVIEADKDNEDETVIIANIKGLESEIKPMIPREKRSSKKLILAKDIVKALGRKNKVHREEKKIKEKQLPKLHIDYDEEKVFFNGIEQNMRPSSENIKADMMCINKYMSGLSAFYGNWKQSEKNYYAFLNWYFASAFMPYLRYVAHKNNYGVTPFPVFGIMYGDSNGGKTKFAELLSKLMCGVKVPSNKSNDFTSTNITALKASCEGLPINIDDLAKEQYNAHYEKIIKDDGWGIYEGFINYPAVVISTNQLASLKPDVSKRVVTCYVGTRIDKETAAKNTKAMNEILQGATNAMYLEYVRRMFPQVKNMANEMIQSGEEYFPDIFGISSKVLKEIFEEYMDVVPEYIEELNYSDYFGDKAVGRNAIDKIIQAWNTDKKMFTIDKKRNQLRYNYTDTGRTYELKNIQQELPPILDASVIGNSLVMKLDEAKVVFGIRFKKGLL